MAAAQHSDPSLILRVAWKVRWLSCMFKITLVFSFISLACSHVPISKVAEASITASPLGAKINKNFQVLKEKYLLGGSRLNYQNPVLCFKNNKKKDV